MRSRRRFIVFGLFICFALCAPHFARASIETFGVRSAVVVDMTTGRVLFEQNADTPIAPASVTKILTLYILFEAIRDGQVHLWDRVEISRRAASTGGSRMNVKAGTRASVEELIKGMAVVSGNDACVAIAEHVSGSVEAFVRRMNAKARDLGMTNSLFLTPNGLPAKGQLTTARDMAKLSAAYLRRFPDSLNIHAMQQYTYNSSTHRNANRLLGRCEGVDGIKTGFVCASGYNIAATAKRENVRILAVVMGAPSPGVRMAETEKLLELGFRKVAPELCNENLTCAVGAVQPIGTGSTGQVGLRKKGARYLKGSVNASGARIAGDSSSRKRAKAARLVEADRKVSSKAELKKNSGISGKTRTVTADKTAAKTGAVARSKPTDAKKTASAAVSGKKPSVEKTTPEKKSNAVTGGKKSTKPPASQTQTTKKSGSNQKERSQAKAVGKGGRG